jgi:predicted transcriptional regulator
MDAQIIENNIEKELNEFYNLKENYNTLLIIYKKEQQDEVYNKLNINKKNKAEIYFYEQM